MQFFDAMDPVLRAFWYIALPASLLFIGQTVLTFMGADATDGVDADFDSNLSGTESPFQLFSFRNLINFMLGFGWAGIALYNSVASTAVLVLLAIIAGSAFVWMFFIIIKQLTKLAEDNSFKPEMAIAKTAEVYLTIPGAMSGKGKILVSVNGSVHELDAVTNGNALPSNTMVRVVSVEGSALLVESL
jgi:hypothetical protein